MQTKAIHHSRWINKEHKGNRSLCIDGSTVTIVNQMGFSCLDKKSQQVLTHVTFDKPLKGAIVAVFEDQKSLLAVTSECVYVQLQTGRPVIASNPKQITVNVSDLVVCRPSEDNCTLLVGFAGMRELLQNIWHPMADIDTVVQDEDDTVLVKPLGRAFPWYKSHMFARFKNGQLLNYVLKGRSTLLSKVQLNKSNLVMGVAGDGQYWTLTEKQVHFWSKHESQVYDLDLKMSSIEDSVFDQDNGILYSLDSSTGTLCFVEFGADEDDKTGFMHLLKSGEFSDCSISAQDREWKLHLAIVCSKSAYFGRLFRGNFREAKERAVVLGDLDNPVDPRLFNEIVNHWYGQALSNKWSLMDYCNLAHLCHQYEEHELMKQCLQNIVQNKSESKLPLLKHVGSTEEWRPIREQIYREIIGQRKIQDLQPDQVTSFDMFKEILQFAVSNKL